MFRVILIPPMFFYFPEDPIRPNFDLFCNYLIFIYFVMEIVLNVQKINNSDKTDTKSTVL